jgi:hypothetical protein
VSGLMAIIPMTRTNPIAIRILIWRGTISHNG